MIVNGNYISNSDVYKSEYEASDAAEALARIFKASAQAKPADSVLISKEAKEAVTEINRENPILEEVKEIALEKYFHFGSRYIKIEKPQTENMGALEEMNRYLKAYGERAVDNIFDDISSSNRMASASKFSGMSTSDSKPLISERA